MRQVCNIAYVAQAERMDDKELKVFHRELERNPAAAPVSRGTGDLMGMLGQAGRNDGQIRRG